MPVEESKFLFSELRKIGFFNYKYVLRPYNLYGKVDYSPAPVENPDALILRVATVNHTLREKALDFHWKMQKLSNRNPIYARNCNLVTEKCLVGEQIK